MPSLRRPQKPADPAGAAHPWRRGVGFVLLGMAVVALHGWLLKGQVPVWGRTLVRPGPPAEGRPQPVRLVSLRTPADRPQPGTATPPRDRARGLAQANPATRFAGAGPASAVRPAVPHVRAETASQGPPSQVASAALSRPDAALAQTEAASGREEAVPGRPVPVYATRVPLAGLLRYRAERGASSGAAELAWAPGPADYLLTLQVTLSGGLPVDWRSRGSFDRDGLSPLRMVERQKQRDRHAVNFQRDKGLVSFAGTSQVVPLWRGAQDRLSVLVQLGAIAQAWPGALAVGAQVHLQVAMPRGDVDEWAFTLAGFETLEMDGQRQPVQRWVREPARPYDQRVEVWLAPTVAELPVGLRWTTVPGGEPLSLWRADLPPAGR